MTQEFHFWEFILQIYIYASNAYHSLQQPLSLQKKGNAANIQPWGGRINNYASYNTNHTIKYYALGKNQQQRILCVLLQNDLQNLLRDKARCTTVHTFCIQNALLWEKERGGGNNTNFYLNLNFKTLPLCILFLNHMNVLSLCDRLHYWSQFFILPVATPLLWPHCGWNAPSHPLTGLGRVTCFHQWYMGRNDRKPVACQKSENTTKPQEPSHYGVGSNSQIAH